MEMLRQLVERIRSQLSVMTRSQQLAIGLCAVIIMGSLLWLTQWSTTPQLEPLVDQPMTAEELNTAVTQLKGMRAVYKEIGDRIYVKPQARRRLYRELQAAGALPQDTSLGFENLLKEQSPFQPESVNRRNFLIALQNELAAVIAEEPAVAAATVFINDAAQRKLGARPSLVPSASINATTTRGGQIDQAKVVGMANLVSAAVAGLEPHRVKVMINGRPRPVPGPEDEISFGLLEEKKKNERHLEDKIHAQLAYIPGVKVAVAVELETTRKHVETREYTEAEVKSEQSTVEESSFGTPAGEAGVNPNTGTALTSAAEGQSTNKDESRSEYFEPMIAMVERSEQIPLTVKKATASINIPRSFFVSLFLAENPDVSTPTNDDLKPLIDVEKSRVKALVQKVLHADDPDVVEVDWFPDLAPDTHGAFAESPLYAGTNRQEAEGTVAALTSYGPQVGLVALALFSLLMMVRLVRKSSRAIDVLLPEMRRGAKEVEESRPLENADLTEGYLVGQEVDEDTLKYRNLSEQVSRMVDEDPETAAELVRRWMGQP